MCSATTSNPAPAKGREASPMQRSTRAKGVLQRGETESSSDDAKVYELKPRKAKNLATNLMHPMVDFQTHLDVKTELNQQCFSKIGLQEFANLPWESYVQNIYAPTHLSLLQISKSITRKETKITGAFFSDIFQFA